MTASLSRAYLLRTIFSTLLKGSLYFILLGLKHVLGWCALLFVTDLVRDSKVIYGVSKCLLTGELEQARMFVFVRFIRRRMLQDGGLIPSAGESFAAWCCLLLECSAWHKKSKSPLKISSKLSFEYGK